jgi:flagellar basal-body rod protein FlgB
MTGRVLGDDTAVILRRALDGLALRHEVISRNIANVDTPGFKASTVTFEQQLQRLIQQGEGDLALVTTDAGHLAAPTTESTQAQIIQRNNLTLREDGNNVDIEREMIELAETNLRYAAASQLLNRKLSLLRLIVNDGR